MAEIAEDEAVLWRSDAVSLGDDRVMFFIFYYHTVKGNCKNSWYECSVRIDTKENWHKLRESLLDNDPAAPFKLTDIGIGRNYRLYYAKRHMMKTDAQRLLNLKFSEKRTANLQDFIEEHTRNIESPAAYPRVYDGKDVFNDTSSFEQGKWYSAPRVKVSHKRTVKVVY